MAVDSETLRTVMRHWATGVAVLTVRDGAHVHGMTVNSFSSVSLEPPLVLVCIERVVRTHGLLEHARTFGLSILAEGQAEISNRFAGRDTEHADRFEGLETYTAVTGAPFIVGNIGYLDCQVVAAHEVGTHTIFVAEVLSAHVVNGSQPLLYYDRAYRKIELLPEQ